MHLVYFDFFWRSGRGLEMLEGFVVQVGWSYLGYSENFLWIRNKLKNRKYNLLLLICAGFVVKKREFEENGMLKAENKSI